jgi:hypothetical protein
MCFGGGYESDDSDIDEKLRDFDHAVIRAINKEHRY